MLEWIDKKILKYLNYNDGFFIEAGSNDGVLQSNTLYLERIKNWKGILIEPSIFAYNKCVINRKKSICYNCALVESDLIKNVSGDFDGSLMSSVDGKRLNNNKLLEVESRTLTSILDEFTKENSLKKIDFFSLDVEGYELNVLKGLDINKYRPIYILIEIYTKDIEEITKYMFNNNYELICNLSDFNLQNNPHWDGTHNDYLFKIKENI
jgi:FkbM family methyltransferase